MKQLPAIKRLSISTTKQSTSKAFTSVSIQSCTWIRITVQSRILQTHKWQIVPVTAILKAPSVMDTAPAPPLPHFLLSTSVFAIVVTAIRTTVLKPYLTTVTTLEAVAVAILAIPTRKVVRAPAAPLAINVPYVILQLNKALCATETDNALLMAFVRVTMVIPDRCVQNSTPTGLVVEAIARMMPRAMQHSTL